MKFLILSLLLAAPQAAAKPCAQTKFGPCTPSKKVQGQILVHIKKGLDSYPDWKESERNEKILRDKLRDNGFRGQEKRLEWKVEYLKMMAAKNATITAFNNALELANTAYRLEQVGPDETITGGPFDGYKPSRKLEFLAMDGYYGYVGEGENRKRLFNPMAGSEDAKAITFRNGARVFKVEAFQEAYDNNNAGILAGTIFHEGSHQRDLVDGNFEEKERTEERAYKSVMDRAKIFSIDPKGNYYKFLETQYKENSAKVKAADRWLLKQKITRYIPFLSAEEQPNGLTPLGIPDHLLRERERQFDEGAARFEKIFSEQSGLMISIASKISQMEVRREREKEEREYKLQKARELQRARKVKRESEAVDKLRNYIVLICNSPQDSDFYYRSLNFTEIWKELPETVAPRHSNNECKNKVFDILRKRNNDMPYLEVPNAEWLRAIAVGITGDIRRQWENSPEGKRRLREQDERRRKQQQQQHRRSPGHRAPIAPDPAPVTPPDDGRNKDLPWCMQAPGRRCIR